MRDMLSTTPQQAARTRRQALFIAAIALVVVYILWNVSLFDFLVYPLRLFVTYVHEAGHSLAALLTGGQVKQFLVSANGSGLAQTIGGDRAIILPAGYLGAAAFGAGLFYLANRFPRLCQGLSFVLGAGMIIFTVLFARPDESGAPIALFIGLAFGALLAGLGYRAGVAVNLFVLNVLALMTALNAVLDIWYLVGAADASRGAVRNDAAAFSAEVTPFLPPAVIAFIWAAIAVLFLGLAIYYGLFKPFQKEIDASYEALQSRSKR